MNLAAFSLTRLCALGLGLVLAIVVQGAETETLVRRWEYSGGRGATIAGSPAVGADHTVYFALTFDTTPETGLVVALKPNAENKWPALAAGGFRTTKGGIESSPVISADGQTLYIGCNDGVLYALNTADGTLKWSFPTGPANAIYAAPALGADGTIYVGSSNTLYSFDSVFYAITPAGVKKWASSASDAIESSPAVAADGTVIYTSVDGLVYAVSGDDGGEKWRFHLQGPVYAAPAIAGDGTVYVGSDASEFYALSLSDGKERWHFNASPGGGVALGADGTVYLGTVETQTTGKFYALDRNGQVKPNFPLSFNGRILTVPTVRADGVVAFGCEDNNFYGINPDGTVRWSLGLGADVNSSPALDTDGTWYLGTVAGKLHSYVGLASPVSEFSTWPMFNHDLRHSARVDPPVVGARLVNLATRGTVGGGKNMIAGAVLQGIGVKQLLFRGVGPTLGFFGVNGTLPDPALEVRLSDLTIDGQSGNSVQPFLNNDWEERDAFSIAALTQQVGAFPLQRGSTDAALVAATNGRFKFTAEVQSHDARSGIALVEIYDGNPSQAEASLVNLSTRGFVGTGAEVLIPGFVISPPGRLRLLARAVGPGLVPFGVGGVLQRPRLTVFAQDGHVLATNTIWTANARKGDLAGAATLVGAFPLADTSTDSAMILSLDPGLYTIQVSGADGGTGEALVEVYVVPY